MIIARIEFKPDHAVHFTDSPEGGQTIVETIYSSPEEMIENIKDLEPYIKDCVAVINGKMLCLSSFKIG